MAVSTTDVSLPPLVDGFGRRHSSLRISVTDRCNIRCFYCMPAEDVVFRPRRELLTFEEIEQFVRAVAPLGVKKLRLTGGEPLVRSDLDRLVAKLVAVAGIEDVALTTNGMLLAEQAAALRAAGLERINVSLDTLREDVFKQITRRDGLSRVLAGIEAAQRVGFERIRLNAVAIRGLTEAEIIPLARFARLRDLELRFIEFMPLDADHHWSAGQLLSGADVRRILEREFGPLIPAERPDPSQPAVDFRFADGRGGIGLINPVSEPFCGDCNRLRLTAEGQLRNCLFSTVEWDARRLLRSGAADQELRNLTRSCVAAKAAAHGIGRPGFHPPERAMYQIGG
ncbi:MAG: GTP 3',8-cyclase MoaA [Planctomycetota bacterium]|nr:MAG: GTP 3',8-cyclase MoaA [Planctomycetota bacterium]